MPSDAEKRSGSRRGAGPGEGSPQQTEHNLLFGVLALELDLIDASQFAEACATWAVRKDVPLAEILRERGWLDEEGRADVQKLLARRVQKHWGDVRRSLAAAADVSVRELISDVADDPVRETLSMLPPSPRGAYVEVQTLDFKPEARSHYTLSRLSGKGGLGRVWLARDQNLNREVALKEILPKRKRSPTAEFRFVREAQITGQLEHPNIVPVYELAQAEDVEGLFYVMRYMRGQTLRVAIKEYHRQRNQGTADPTEFRRLLHAFVSVCNAMEYAHSRGVIHRDLKPSNVMLGAHGEVTVVDWGLAKLVDRPSEEMDGPGLQLGRGAESELTQPGQAPGTPAYMAPEQVDASAGVVDRRTDIYGLGGILFEILTSAVPHRGTGTEELLSQIVSAPTPRARSVDRSVPAALDAICARAMSKRASDRYRCAKELADDIQRWLADEPVSVYRDPWSHRLFRWMRRHRAWTVSTAVVLLIVTLSVSVALCVVDRARRAEEEARGRAQAALGAEKEARKEAHRRFKESLGILDTMLTGVGEVLRYYPAMQPLRTHLLERAADEYQRFAAEAKDDPELLVESGRALVRLGDAYRSAGQQHDAAEAFRQATDIFRSLVSRLPDLKLESVECLIRLGAVETEAAEYQRAGQTFGEAEAELGRLDDGAKSRLASARLLVSRALRLDALDQTANAMELLTEAERELEKLAGSEAAGQSACRESLAWARSIRGRMLIVAGRPRQAIGPIEQAVEAYEKLVEENVVEPRYHEGLAQSRIHLANARQALGELDQEMAERAETVADLEPLLGSMTDVAPFNDYWAVSRANLGQSHHHLGQNQLAKDELDQALARFYQRLIHTTSPLPRTREQFAMACTLQGQILRDLGDPAAEDNFESARRIYDLLLKEHPDRADYYRGLGECQRHLARLLDGSRRHGEARLAYDRAMAHFTKSLELNPDDPYTQDGLAWCHEHRGDLRAALGEDPHEDWREAERIRRKLWEPRNTPEDAYKRAMLLLKLGNAAESVELARDLTNTVPTNPNYQTLLGAALYRVGSFEESVGALSKCASFEGDGCCQFWLSMAIWRRDLEGDPDKARSTYQQAVALMERNAPARIEVIRLREEAAGVLGVEGAVGPKMQPPTKPDPKDAHSRNNG